MTSVEKLLKLSPPILFVILTSPWAILFFYGFTDADDYAIWQVLAFVVAFLWYSFLDFELMKRIPLKIRPSDSLFFVNLILLFLLNTLVYIFLVPGEQINVTGIAALPIFYVFYAYFQIFNHLSKLLAYAEKEEEVKLKKRIPEMLSFCLFFIGVWWLQPRIIKILNRPAITPQKYISIKEKGEPSTRN